MKTIQDCEEPCRSRCFKRLWVVGCDISSTTYSIYRVLEEYYCCSEICSASVWSLEAARTIGLTAALISKSGQTLLLRGSDAYCSPRRSLKALQQLQINVEQYSGQGYWRLGNAEYSTSTQTPWWSLSSAGHWNPFWITNNEFNWNLCVADKF